MSFIDSFLDVTANLPREIVRLLKLYRTVEERSKNINDNLTSLRQKHLREIKEMKNKIQTNEEIMSINDKYYNELLNLSEYRQKLIEELEYILKNNFIQKISPIIEGGRKECREQLLSTGAQYGTTNKTTIEDNIIIYNDKRKNEKILGIKTNRPNKKITKKGNLDKIEYSEENQLNLEENSKDYCFCKENKDEPMIMCEQCLNWFHYKCVNIVEGKEPEHYFCPDCKNKNEDDNNNTIDNANANTKTKKREKNNKKKKHSQK